MSKCISTITWCINIHQNAGNQVKFLEENPELKITPMPLIFNLKH